MVIPYYGLNILKTEEISEFSDEKFSNVSSSTLGNARLEIVTRRRINPRKKLNPTTDRELYCRERERDEKLVTSGWGKDVGRKQRMKKAFWYIADTGVSPRARRSEERDETAVAVAEICRDRFPTTYEQMLRPSWVGGEDRSRSSAVVLLLVFVLGSSTSPARTFTPRAYTYTCSSCGEAHRQPYLPTWSCPANTLPH